MKATTTLLDASAATERFIQNWEPHLSTSACRMVCWIIRSMEANRLASEAKERLPAILRISGTSLLKSRMELTRLGILYTESSVGRYKCNAYGLTDYTFPE